MPVSQAIDHPSFALKALIERGLGTQEREGPGPQTQADQSHARASSHPSGPRPRACADSAEGVPGLQAAGRAFYLGIPPHSPLDHNSRHLDGRGVSARSREELRRRRRRNGAAATGLSADTLPPNATFLLHGAGLRRRRGREALRRSAQAQKGSRRSEGKGSRRSEGLRRRRRELGVQ